MDIIGADCERIINKYKYELEKEDHKKKFIYVINHINNFKGIINYAINGITVWCKCGEPFINCTKGCLSVSKHNT